MMEFAEGGDLGTLLAAKPHRTLTIAFSVGAVCIEIISVKRFGPCDYGFIPQNVSKTWKHAESSARSRLQCGTVTEITSCTAI